LLFVFLFYLCLCFSLLNWTFLVALTSSVCLLDFSIFDFFSRTSVSVVTKVGTNHP
jgi:hypothetical protein